MNRETAIRRIKAMLARGDSDRNDNEHEREVAIRQATKLMDKFQLSRSDVLGAEDAGGMDVTKIATGSALWRCQVVGAIARLYGCSTTRSRGSQGTTQVYGKEYARTVVESVSLWLMRSIDAEATSLRRRDRAFRNSFRLGAASGVYTSVERIEAARKQGETLAPENRGQALAVVASYEKDTAASKEFQGKVLAAAGVKLTSPARATVSDYAGYSDGYAYGSKINLNKQLG